MNLHKMPFEMVVFRNVVLEPKFILNCKKRSALSWEQAPIKRFECRLYQRVFIRGNTTYGEAKDTGLGRMRS